MFKFVAIGRWTGMSQAEIEADILRAATPDESTSEPDEDEADEARGGES